MPPAVCESCQSAMLFPDGVGTLVHTEFTHAGRLRADVAATFPLDGTYGVVEVVYSSPPSAEALAVHEQLTFAYYRYLSHDSPSSRPTAWLCSPECWRWFMQNGGSVSSSWQPPQCDSCRYLHENNLSSLPFNSWAYDPIHDALYPLRRRMARGRAMESTRGTRWGRPSRVVTGWRF